MQPNNQPVISVISYQLASWVRVARTVSLLDRSCANRGKIFPTSTNKMLSLDTDYCLVKKYIADAIIFNPSIVKLNTSEINSINFSSCIYSINYQLYGYKSYVLPSVQHQLFGRVIAIIRIHIVKIFTDKNIVNLAAKCIKSSRSKIAYLTAEYAIALPQRYINTVLSRSRNYRITHLSIAERQKEFVKIITPATIEQFWQNLYLGVMSKFQPVAAAMKTPGVTYLRDDFLFSLYQKISSLRPTLREATSCLMRLCGSLLHPYIVQRQIPVIYTPVSIFKLGENQEELEKPANYQGTGKYGQFLAHLLSQVNDVVIATDNQRRVTYWNPRAEELYNIKASEIIGQSLNIAFECVWLHPEEQEACVRALASSGFWKGENIHRQGNGKEIHVESSISVLQDEESTAIGLLMVVRDIGDIREQLRLRKLAEQTLREREERWNLVLQGSNDGIWDWNVQTNQVFFSSRWKQMRGFAEDEIGNSLDEWSQRVHPDDLDWVMQSVTDYFARQTPLFAVEYRTRCQDGSYKWIFSRGIALWDEGGKVLRMAGSETDITARKLAEQQAREQAALIDITTDAILVLSLAGDIVFCNQGAYRVYGWEQAEMQGKNARQLLYDDSSIPQLDLARQMVLEHGEWHGELHQYRKDDRKIIVEARWTVIRDERGNAKSILTVATDITEKKQLEAQFLRTQRLQSIGTLASGIAHDLNNILTPILAVAQLLPLKLTHIDENTQELIKIVLDNCKRGSDLIKQILSFARGTETERTNLQAGHLLVEVARVARQTFPKSIEICMDIATKNLWTVSADATQLHQVLMNLCLNARDAMTNGGTLTLAIANLFIDENYARMHLDARVGSYVVMTISDTGCGISPENIDRIFEPFFTTKELGQGTGLGLSTVVGIIKTHGGFVDVYSEVGKGTCFKVYLPAVSGTENQTFSELEPPPGAGELILIVDDETSILEITKTSLETYNYQALIARDGIEAIALFAKHEQEIKAVLIDLMMPALDSMTTIRTLQKLNPQVPIIVMSGLASNEVLSQAASTNIQAFLAKPFTAWELLNTLQKVKLQNQ